MSEQTVIELRRRDLLVVAGLPGAGKTTMLRHAAGALPVLDSDDVRASLSAALPAAMPYRCYRLLVHAWHRCRIVARSLRTDGPVVVHEPSTRVSTRALFAVLGALTGRPVRLLWLDVTPEEARAGQRSRGRVVRARAFARHVRRARNLDVGRVPRGWHSVQVIDREVAGKLVLVGDGPGPGGVDPGHPLLRRGTESMRHGHAARLPLDAGRPVRGVQEFQQRGK